jgi:multidrug efflux pump
MRMTELFIRRPVLSVVVSVLILVAGLRAEMGLPVQHFPTIVSASIQIQTAYYGADAATIAGFITTPIENAVAATEGLDYVSSTSLTGVSTVTLFLRLNQDPNRAMTEVQSYVNSATALLPQGFQAPLITVRDNANGVMELAVSSRTLSTAQVSDYVSRTIQPQLQSVPGVQQVFNEIGEKLALRVWLEPDRLAGYGLSATDIVNALQNNDLVTGVGQTLGGATFINLAVNSGLQTLEQFRALVVRRSGSALVRLGDVARIEFGSDSTNVAVRDGAGSGTLIAVNITPTANLLDVERGLLAVVGRINAHLPPGMDVAVLHDGADYVYAARHEVLVSLAESLAIVAAVIFLFLGSPRAVLIPLVTIPLSLIGTFALMAAMGFSINLLTLLALVLAIGLVVDDAIIMVENVSRHLADGMRPFEAAIKAARQLAGPIVAMTVVLIAAYLPVGLQKGLTGALFTEFAFTLAASVTVSAVLALTLSPMMCSRMLRAHAGGEAARQRLTGRSDRALHAMQSLYARLLSAVLDVWPVPVAIAAAVMVSIVFLFTHARHELAPQEDSGWVFISGTPPASAGLDQLMLYDPQVIAAIARVPERSAWWTINAPGNVFDAVVLGPWDERTRTATDVQNQLQEALNKVAGLSYAIFQPPPLPGAEGLPIQFVVQTAASIDTLATVVDRLMTDARRTGQFAYIDKDLKIDLPQRTIELDRDRVSELGLDVNSVGTSLNWLLGGNFVNYFSLQQRSYRVMPLVVRDRRLNPEQLLDYPIANIGGVPIKLSSVATLSRQVVPEQIAHFQQQNSSTILATMAPGVSVDEGLSTLKRLAAADLPTGFSTDTSGPLREYVAEAGSFLPSFAFGMVIIYLALAALFESLRDPAVILISVPMSVAGALFIIWLGVGGATVNLYSEIGLVTLAGLISKHGILIVEVAREQQLLGLDKRAAIEHAAALRLRPILMTTTAMVLGVMPLVFATGAGAESRFAMGLVIASGLAIGTCFTLFVVPAVYLVVGARHSPDREVEAAAAVRGAA